MRSDRGMTLVELVIGLALGLLLALGIAQLWAQFLQQKTELEARQDAAGEIEALLAELQMHVETRHGDLSLCATNGSCLGTQHLKRATTAVYRAEIRTACMAIANQPLTTDFAAPAGRCQQQCPTGQRPVVWTDELGPSDVKRRLAFPRSGNVGRAGPSRGVVAAAFCATRSGERLELIVDAFVRTEKGLLPLTGVRTLPLVAAKRVHLLR